MRRCKLPERPLELVERLDAVQVHFVHGPAGKVQVRLLEARDDHPPAHAPARRLRPGPRLDLLVAADGQDAVPADRLWVNPDCGLKTRDWAEVDVALRNMVDAAAIVRRAVGA